MTTPMEGQVMVDQEGYLRGFSRVDVMEFGRDWKCIEAGMYQQ